MAKRILVVDDNQDAADLLADILGAAGHEVIVAERTKGIGLITGPQAVALGYRHDATKVDAKKYPTWSLERACGKCQLFQGQTTDAWGPCAAVGGKLVNAKGWCVAWVKKA